jgi:hypothetical protein
VHAGRFGDIYILLRRALEQVRVEGEVQTVHGLTRTVLREGLNYGVESIRYFIFGVSKMRHPDFLARLIISDRLEKEFFIKYIFASIVFGSIVAKLLGVEKTSFEFIKELSGIFLVGEFTAVAALLALAFAVTLPAHLVLRLLGGTGKIGHAFIAISYSLCTFYPLSVVSDKMMSSTDQSSQSGNLTSFETIYVCTILSRIYRLRYRRAYAGLFLATLPWFILGVLTARDGRGDPVATATTAPVETVRPNRDQVEALLIRESGIVDKYEKNVLANVVPLIQKAGTEDYKAGIRELSVLIPELQGVKKGSDTLLQLTAEEIHN